jgi:4-hydroxybenzoate polyprenyltransferase
MSRAYVELLRPANVVTAIADVLAGFAIAGLRHPDALPWLIVSSCCLYAGGVVLNDVFDRDLDRVERPERPIPSGRVSTPRAAALGGGLLAAGVASGAVASLAAGGIALAIALVVLLYDAWGKRQAPIAPLNMALCRALNLMLGVAAVPAALSEAWPIAAVPLLYIYAVTVLSRGEVHGGSARAASSALIILVTAIGALLLVVIRAGGGAAPNLAAAVVLAAALSWRVVPAFAAARRRPAPGTIRAAVKRGILSLVLVDAAIAAGFAGPLYAAVILVTGLVAGWLARTFAVT